MTEMTTEPSDCPSYVISGTAEESFFAKKKYRPSRFDDHGAKADSAFSKTALALGQYLRAFP